MHLAFYPVFALAVISSAIVFFVLRLALGPASRFALWHLVRSDPFRRWSRLAVTVLLLAWWISTLATIALLRGWL